MRISASWTERALGSRVSGSVAARCSAMARLRRLASTGAACETADVIASHSGCLSAPSLATSSEPITSPPTSEGTHSEPRPARSHSSQPRSGSASGSRSCAFPRRMARQARGAAPASASPRPATAEGSVLASSEFPLALRVEHDGGGVGHDPLGAPAQQVLDLELVVGALERLDVLAPLAGALAVAARLALNREHADGQQEDAKPDHEGEHDPARTLEVGLGALLDVALQSAVLGAQLVHERLASARVLDADRPRAAALDLIDRDPRVRLPLARGRGQVAHELQSRSVASGALLGNAVRALELRLPGLVRREEVAVGGQRVAAQARLLVEHRGQQVARGAQLPLIVDHRLALLAGDQPDARADHEDGHRQQHSQSCVNGHTHDLCRPRAEKLESAPCRLSAGA